MYFKKYFKGWNKLNLRDKSYRLQRFLSENHKEIGHNTMDEIFIILSDLFSWEDSE